jgi:hypothetical protein
MQGTCYISSSSKNARDQRLMFDWVLIHTRQTLISPQCYPNIQIMMIHSTIDQSIVQLFRSCDYGILKELMRHCSPMFGRHWFNVVT